MFGVTKTHMQFMSHDISKFSHWSSGQSTRWSNWATHSSKQANRKAVRPVPAEYSSRPPWGCSPPAKSERVVYAWRCTGTFCSSCETASNSKIWSTMNGSRWACTLASQITWLKSCGLLRLGSCEKLSVHLCRWQSWRIAASDLRCLPNKKWTRSFESIRNSMRRRVLCCVQMQGQHFEHLL
jgi:hypothetical protein